MITLCPEFKFLASLRPNNAWLTFGQRFWMESNALGEALKIILQVRIELPFSYAYCVPSVPALVMKRNLLPHKITHGRTDSQRIVAGLGQRRRSPAVKRA